MHYELNTCQRASAALRTVIILTILLLKLEAGESHGLLGQSESYVCYRAGEKMSMDGKATERAWKKAPWTHHFVDIEGAKKPLPRYRTRVKMLWDDEYFYLLAVMEEPHLWATYKQRDSVIFHENDIEVFIDPDGDTHGYYELEINALGTEWDLLLLRPYRDANGAEVAENSWNMPGLRKGIDLQGTLNDPSDKDTGWVVEMAIPWKELERSQQAGKRPTVGDQWRVNFSRVQWMLDVKNGKYVKRKGEDGKALAEANWVWSPQGVIAMHQPESWGRVQFSKLISGEGVEPFVVKREDALKDVLREVYYAQSIRKKVSKQYGKNLQELMPEKFLQQWGEKLKMIVTKGGYKLRLTEKKLTLALDQTGRVWTIKNIQR